MGWVRRGCWSYCSLQQHPSVRGCTVALQEKGSFHFLTLVLIHCWGGQTLWFSAGSLNFIVCYYLPPSMTPFCTGGSHTAQYLIYFAKNNKRGNCCGFSICLPAVGIPTNSEVTKDCEGGPGAKGKALQESLSTCLDLYLPFYAINRLAQVEMTHCLALLWPFMYIVKWQVNQCNCHSSIWI